MNKSAVTTLNQAKVQLEPQLNPMGVNQVNSECSALSRSYSDLEEETEVRAQKVQQALEERKAFWNEWETFEKWLGRTQKKVSATNEIYSDDMKAAAKKLEVCDY